jgi:glycerol-3-phosphate acyltransferase PlsY
LSIVYIYLIGSITFNVLARKSLEAQVRTLGSDVSELELSYLNSTNKIDKSYATSLGFVDVKDNIFASRNTSRVAIR